MDYEQLYYDEKYKNKQLEKEISNLKDEISILKGNKTLIEYIINKSKDKLLPKENNLKNIKKQIK
jgi:hypothetical protein